MKLTEHDREGLVRIIDGTSDLHAECPFEEDHYDDDDQCFGTCGMLFPNLRIYDFDHFYPGEIFIDVLCPCFFCGKNKERAIEMARKTLEVGEFKPVDY